MCAVVYCFQDIELEYGQISGACCGLFYSVNQAELGDGESGIRNRKRGSEHDNWDPQTRSSSQYVGFLVNLETLTKITEGNGRKDDVEGLKEMAYITQTASLCGLGQTAPNPVLSTIRYFMNEYEGEGDGFYVFIEYAVKYANTKNHKEFLILKHRTSGDAGGNEEGERVCKKKSDGKNQK